MADNFKIIVISNPTPIIDESTIIADLFNNGLELFHLRKPFDTIFEIEKLLKNIPEKFHNKIVIHQHYKLLECHNLKGIHIKSNDKNPPTKYNIISTSFHSIAELANKNNYQYVFFSPIFNSISKDGYNSKFTLKELKAAYNQKIIDSKVIALGGINPDNIRIIKELGFGGVATLGYIWGR